MRIKRWFFNQSTNNIIVLALIATLFVSILISNYFLYSFHKSGFEKALHEDHLKTTTILTKSFQQPLKECSKSVTQGLVDSLFIDPRVVEISIWDFENSKLFMHVFKPERVKDELFTQTMPIIIDEKRYGEVSVKFSSTTMLSQINSLLQANIILFLIQFILNLSLLLWIFYIKFSKPLTRLLSYIRTLGDYNITPHSAWHYQDEIGRIGKAFEEAKKTIALTAMSDPQTGIYNHYMLTKLLQNLFVQPKQNLFTVILIEIINFNHINEYFGHLKGNATLLALTKDITKAKNVKHYFGRWSGSMLMLICPNEGVEEVREFALNLSNQLERTLYEDKVSVICAIAVAQTLKSETSIDDLLRRLNLALEDAKQSPFGQVIFSTS